MNFFQTKYRVVSDRWNGYEAQFKWWWCPFWFMVGFSNTKTTLEDAQELCKPGWKRSARDGSPIGTVLWVANENSQSPKASNS